jgi:hypothetical protein
MKARATARILRLLAELEKGVGDRTIGTLETEYDPSEVASGDG